MKQTTHSNKDMEAPGRREADDPRYPYIFFAKSSLFLMTKYTLKGGRCDVYYNCVDNCN